MLYEFSLSPSSDLHTTTCQRYLQHTNSYLFTYSTCHLDICYLVYKCNCRRQSTSSRYTHLTPWLEKWDPHPHALHLLHSHPPVTPPQTMNKVQSIVGWSTGILNQLLVILSLSLQMTSQWELVAGRPMSSSCVGEYKCTNQTFNAASFSEFSVVLVRNSYVFVKSEYLWSLYLYSVCIFLICLCFVIILNIFLEFYLFSWPPEFQISFDYKDWGVNPEPSE